MQKLETYDSLKFTQTIQTLKKIVSSSFMLLLSTDTNLKNSFRLLQDVFLLFREDFFSLFAEETAPLRAKPPDKFAEDRLNQKAFYGALVRLGLGYEDQDFKGVRFLLKAQGFQYSHFKTGSNLKFCGNVEQRFSSLRLKSADNRDTEKRESHCSVWNVVKQNVKRGFELGLSMRFKAVSDAGMGLNRVQILNRATLCLGIQVKVDVRSSKQALKLTSLQSLVSGLFFEFGFEFSNSGRPGHKAGRHFENFVQVSMKQKGKSQIIQRIVIDPEQIDFSDEDIVYAKLSIGANGLRVKFSNENILQNSNPEIQTARVEIPFDFASSISLDNGCAWLGLLNTSKTTKYDTDVFNWSLKCSNPLSTSSPWGGLVPHFKRPFPANLVITSEIIEDFSAIFQFVFPIRCLKHSLRQIFLDLMILRRKKYPQYVLLKFSLIRNLLQVFVDAALEYLRLDLLHPLWERFFDVYTSLPDFDVLRKSLNHFVSEAKRGLFLNFKSISKCFSDLVASAKLLEMVLAECWDHNPDAIAQRLDEVYLAVHRAFGKLVTSLFIIIDMGNAEFASKLILKLNFNDYFRRFIQENMP